VQLALRSIKASDEITPFDADSDRRNISLADQPSVTPSTANVNVASGSGAGIMSETALFSSLYLEDKAWTIPSSETETSSTLAGLNRPMNKEFLSNNRYQQVLSMSNIFSF
jgi:exosome complex exonuclease RRP6